MANFADKVDPAKFAPTVRFNTHYSAQADVMMGSVDVNAALGVDGKASAHMGVQDTCVGCHMGEGMNHTFKAEAQVAVCVACHADATSVDVNGFPTELAAKVKELETALAAKNLIVEGEEGYAAVPQKEATALDAKTAGAVFTYFLYEEDGSEGIHNPAYFTALVDAALAAVK
jgi:cytochrome c553